MFKMFKLCKLINFGHDYELLSHNSVGPNGFDTFNYQGHIPQAFQMRIVGYTKTVQVCKNCGKVKTTITLGV